MQTKSRQLAAGLGIALGAMGLVVATYAVVDARDVPTGARTALPTAWADEDMNPVSPTPAPADPNRIANPSLESASGSPGMPRDWLVNNWGDNNAAFQYITDEGRHGTKSAKVTVTDYVDGDAKWLPEPVPLEPGEDYRYTAWYKTNGRAHVVAMVLKADGSQSHVGMPLPLPAGDAATTWQYYSETFTVPEDAVSVSPFMYLSSNGFLQIDQVGIQPYTPERFDRPLVTLTFDDSPEDNAATALPAMDSRGLKSTQCVATGLIADDPVAQQVVLDYRDAGHEICAHSVTHPYLTEVSPEQLAVEAEDSRRYLRELTGEPVDNFATPYGDYNSAVVNELRKRYGSHRTVDEGYNSKGDFDPYRIRVQNLTPETSLEQFQGWLDHAAATNTWLVLVYHRIPGPGMPAAGPFDTPLKDFEEQLDALVASGITVKTLDAALEELVPQAG